MKPKKVIAVIEKASDGGYGIYIPSIDGMTGYGTTIDEAKDDLRNAIDETVAYCKESGRNDSDLNNGNLDIDYRYDLSGFFMRYNFFDVSSLGRAIGINPSLMRQYKTGKAYISDKQKEKIMNAIHSLASELSTVRF